MQAILATQSKCTLDEVAVSADKIHETMPEARVFAINNNANPSSAITGTHGNFDATISALSQQVQDLSRQLAALQTSQSGYVSRFGTRAPSRYRLRSRSKPRDGKCCPMLLPKKRHKQSVVAAYDCARNTCRLFIRNRNDGVPFLIDRCECFPQKTPASDVVLFAVNGTRLPTYGLRTQQLNLGLRREFKWQFIIADVSYAIIGADFIHHYKLLVDLRNRRLIDSLTQVCAECEIRVVDVPTVKTLCMAGASEYHRLLLEFPAITKPPNIHQERRHNTVHFIRTTDGPPVSCRPRRLVPDRYKAAKKEFDAMVRDGIVRPSDDYGVVINSDKCKFGQSEVTFLGYHISDKGTQPPTDRVHAILDMKKPSTLKELQRFLGMGNFYLRFIPQAARIQAPMTQLQGGPKAKQKETIKWCPETENAFEATKRSLANAALLAHPSPEAPLSIMVDASDSAISAVLQQWNDQAWQPLSFFTRKLSSTQRKYTTFDRELLAAYTAVRKFRHNVESRSFVIFTDHKPLIYSMNQNPEKASPRQFRYLDFN
ncbi:hypothetical protein TcasGA2_TC031613 [Tribolium castaneum]|uniref:Reverse transcriptase/retrotransposon-derived protein RNase H-like domain-containing protein n=1 Tax=Tribolium castaneum TaxID=7070 RepID=A0A139WAI8_TRICA|nr:hypothetical protein TcasGA2_TC031613 [Tribolium castaneum]